MASLQTSPPLTKAEGRVVFGQHVIPSTIWIGSWLNVQLEAWMLFSLLGPSRAKLCTPMQYGLVAAGFYQTQKRGFKRKEVARGVGVVVNKRDFL